MRHKDLLTRENTALVIVDVQEKLLPFVLNPEKIVANIARLMKFAEIMQLPIVMTEHYPRGLGTTIKEIKDAIPKYEPIEKVIFSCFGSSAFISRLKSIGMDTLMLTGIETHICIQQTALDALKHGYKVHVISDATSSRKKEDIEIGTEKMRQAGVIISGTELAMYEIMERADTKEFKEVLKLVKV